VRKEVLTTSPGLAADFDALARSLQLSVRGQNKMIATRARRGFEALRLPHLH
jgi:hypothetical protein